jgi:ethanolamine ammonia-lyase small subunit
MASGDEITFNALLQRIRERTPARLLEGRCGGSYRTWPQLELRQAHAAAVDAVRDELDLNGTLGEEFCRRWNLFEVVTEASSKAEYLLRPDKGRRLTAEGVLKISQRCNCEADLQVVIGDGLSVAAVAAQVPKLLPLIMDGASGHGLTLGQPFVIRHCRVGVINDVGEISKPQVVVLLIGERPGLATAESLSAYIAYRPKSVDTDADRNLVSNIHSRGTPPSHAAERIMDLAKAMIQQKISGTRLASVNRSLMRVAEGVDSTPDS